MANRTLKPVTLIAAGVAMALGLAACSPASDDTRTAEREQRSSAEQATEQANLQSGLFLEDYDRTTRPQDDLFRYVNGAWYDNTEIPSDMSSYGAFRILAEENELRLRGIIEDAAATEGAEHGSNEQKLGDFYASFMDTDRIEELGVSPIQQELDMISGVSNHEQLTATMAQLRLRGVGGPFGYYVWADARNPDYNALYMSQSGLGLPDRDYYFRDSEDFAEIREKYKSYIADMLSAAGHDDAESAAERIYALEERLAEAHWTRAESRDAEATYNKMSKEELDELLGEFNYSLFASQAELEAASEMIVRMPSYFEAFGEVFADTELQTWQDYMQLRTLSTFASRLSSEFADLNFDFYQTTLSGVPEQQERWKRAVQATNGVLGEALGEEYVERYFPPEAKARMEELIDNLLAAFEDSINDLEWMSDETKEQALDKLSKFTPKIGYPNQWEDYSELEIFADDLVGNTKRAAAWSYRDMTSRIGEPVDREEWGMTPQTVNAYYSPTANEIVFPAGILQPPFFDMNADDAVNYGGIGAVIGHEIGHGFDDQGSRYDGDGNLQNWWTDADREQFDGRAQVLVDQFNSYEPLEGLNIDGQVALGENIGDLVGLTTAFRAYQKSLEGEDSPVIDGYTGEQRFFLSWGQIWKIKMRDDAMREQIARGPHAPGKYRAMGAPRNVDAFYEAFDVQEGDGMYIPPEERVRIW
ncbi:M13 family metallopeptidase [Aliidiomarina maris]|uniref:Endothelin-converting enzyme n=1 Tax=Aliidiomarina maris TaxID=531312 RepID=A0A327X375_9GAMM|nr:M13 family metallopeptidase [Aliidiomarina maris]RAK00590.1 endothelin-converting enzyme [Aliidiomarina maris]RUO27397.1 peptidase M13 [Aliidiomarina maris]